MANNDCSLEKGLISVIMGNYNTPVNYLREAIDSVLAQTYSNFEFIIVDDCSTDDSCAAIESYTDPRIRLIRNEKNLGLAASMNRALELCRGEYVARMDSDDVCFPQRFEKQMAYMEQNPDVILCGSYVRFIDENGDSPRGEWRVKFTHDPDVYRIHLLFSNHPLIVHPSWMMNNRLLQEHHIRYHEPYKYAQDYSMLVRCSHYGKCDICPEVLLKYRTHGNQVSSQHKAEQIKYDYQIIQDQLDELHLVLPEEIRDLHLRYLQVKKPYDKRLRRWLCQIIKANRKYGVYNQTKLCLIIMRRWGRICLERILGK